MKFLFLKNFFDRLGRNGEEVIFSHKYALGAHKKSTAYQKQLSCFQLPKTACERIISFVLRTARPQVVPSKGEYRKITQKMLNRSEDLSLHEGSKVGGREQVMNLLYIQLLRHTLCVLVINLAT